MWIIHEYTFFVFLKHFIVELLLVQIVIVCHEYSSDAIFELVSIPCVEKYLHAKGSTYAPF